MKVIKDGIVFDTEKAELIKSWKSFGTLLTSFLYRKEKKYFVIVKNSATLRWEPFEKSEREALEILENLEATQEIFQYFSHLLKEF
jgi:hypothetical protein